MPSRSLALFLLYHISAYVTATTTVHSTITSTVATLTTTITLPIPNPTSSSSRSESMESTSLDFQATILNSTNTYREIYQANNVTYDTALADYALNHAKKCIWEHSHGPYGENLALGYITFPLAIDAWAAEESLYNYGSGKFSQDTGHFTQLVWKNTTKVGCGAVNCTEGIQGWFVVCEYDPPGNVQGEFKEMVGMRESSEGRIGIQAGRAGRTEVDLGLGVGMLGFSLAVLLL